MLFRSDVCQREGIGVIARVPFDEGSLTGTLTAGSRWPQGDFRNIYFKPPYLQQALDRVGPVEELTKSWGSSLPDTALRFVLAHPAVTTVIPGMRKPAHVDANLAVSGNAMPAEQRDRLRAFRWNRRPDDRA